ncbi:hypothetical protein AHiyo8_49490 [Arthrobacter sp. Hiyo8]|nr:hypothetical protein AHiyo8_49490 [Arthrobacter sp. Hiyo8]
MSAIISPPRLTLRLTGSMLKVPKDRITGRSGAPRRISARILATRTVS